MKVTKASLGIESCSKQLWAYNLKANKQTHTNPRES